MSGVPVPPPIEVLHGHGVALACGADGELRADELHGLFAADTRVLSTYRMTLGGQKWQLLSRTRVGHGTARWRFQSPRISDPRETLPEGCLFLELDRRVAGALHDDLRISCYAAHPVRTTLVLQVDADFADIFEVRGQQHLPPRVAIERTPRHNGLTLAYERGDFRRGLHVTIGGPPELPEVVGSLLVFDLVLERDREWRLCVDAAPEINGVVTRFAGDPHEAEERDQPQATLSAGRVLAGPFECGCADLRALEIGDDQSEPFVAGGAPWYYTLFGRDSLLPGLMGGLVGSRAAAGALAALAALQAVERDDWRDAEPGKLPHEVRRGELARFELIPHACYYGAHDVPSLYCLALWGAWRWTGDRGLLDAHLEAAEAALRWCDELGDRDGDGLQEYATRSRSGYYNQSWKDAGDAIVDEQGELAETPLATVELQGYLYAARLAMGELLDASGASAGAERLRDRASELRELVEERYWLPDREYYALALDGGKRALETIASNAGQLLWTGLPTPERAGLVARRLLAPDMFTGWGLRTLSSEHPRYNPLSYQRGSVWPHDTALAAAGLWRYGLRDEASTLLRAVLEAACAFEGDRLPELFCGFDRSLGAPVPYREANSPQAWAAAVPVLAVQAFLGLVPDAPRNRCFLDPWLPDWLPEFRIDGIPIGEGTLSIAVARYGDETVIDEVSGSVEAVRGSTSAALWGTRAAET